MFRRQQTFGELALVVFGDGLGVVGEERKLKVEILIETMVDERAQVFVIGGPAAVATILLDKRQAQHVLLIPKDNLADTLKKRAG